mmetsp:Transcript_12063/g.36342  ORF Transcript_12063/g.36342 Transcript_12063/m.36342 type:complete len:420 (+) Transcript_12063:126-1385(+)
MMMESSMRRMVMAASVAKRRDLILEMAGSRTPALRLSRTAPASRSRPVCLRESAPLRAAAWLARSLATRSMASLAALTARVRGMTRRASAKSATASCSREPREWAKSSRKTESAASTAPPPATTAADSRTRLTTIRTSWRARSISSRWNSLAPRSTMVVALAEAQPRTYSISPSPTRSSTTSSASPRVAGSTVSLPSTSARVTTTEPPVARARRVKSSFLTRLAAMAPASTKYFKHASSMPFVVSTTFAPAARIFSILSLVMSISLWRTPSTSWTPTSTVTPVCTRCRCSGKSSNAIFAFVTTEGMPCAALAVFNAKPSTNSLSVLDLPWAFSTWIADTGYRAFLSSPGAFVLTDFTAFTANALQNSGCEFKIFDAMLVFAALANASSPNWSVATISVDLTYFTASFSASLYPDITVVG